MVETKEVNWLEEAERLEEGQEFEGHDWFIPEEGRYSIEILSNGEPYEMTYGTEEEPKVVDKIRLEIKVNDSEEIKNWGITKGKTKKSLYGQLCTIAKQNKGALKGAKITLLVKGKKKNKDYTIPEAIESGEKKEETPEVSFEKFTKGILSYIKLRQSKGKNTTRQDLYRIYHVTDEKMDKALNLLEEQGNLIVELDGGLVAL